jgi:ATP-dependent helicase/nuclease subunit B
LVGSWPELVALATNAYLIANQSNDWRQVFHIALESLPDAFWSYSYDVAPQETAAEVEAALSLLVSATQPGSQCDRTNLQQLPDRPRKHVQDIVRLLDRLDGALPDNLFALHQLVAAESHTAIRNLMVCHIEGFPALTLWQDALINRLNADAGIEPANELMSLLQSMLNDSASMSAQTSLQTVQRHLFSSAGDKTQLDNSVQCLAVRDCLAEAEVTASMAQQILAENPGLMPADIGLLVPDTFEYSLAVNDAFSAAGLPLSGLPVDHWQRDLGREALFYFLYCRQKPSPAMALAVCLSSPLMPWSKGHGAELAQAVMDGDYRLRPFTAATQADRWMLDLLREGDESPVTLTVAIQTFVHLLAAGEQFESHVYRAKTVAEDLCATLAGVADIDWVTLRQISSPKNISTGALLNFNVQGITVWREPHEAWRPVRFLFVLGFASGHYPLVSADSAVFVSDDLLALRESMNLSVVTPADRMRERRERFGRQLTAVADSVSFMIPRRDASGAVQSPSESLVFMQQLFSGIGDAESLILELDAQSDREPARFLPAIQAVQTSPPRETSAEDIQFEIDLLSLRTDAQGNLRPESPSSLETLMVSRLAWLLRRIDAEPLGWEPERPDAMLLGTLTHQVFEELFQVSRPIPDSPVISAQIEPLLDSAIRTHAPFLRAAQWQVERKHLASSIHKAAVAWREVLVTLKADILGTEEWLQGTLDGLPIHGQADILLGLPDGRLLVVDYKRSSSNSRRPRMQKGYDSQANLYRTMLQTGGPKSEDNTALLDRLRAGDTTGIVYFMTNDQTSLSDALVVESGAIPGWEVLEGDVAHLAMGLIRERLWEVSEGHLYLNREGDAQFFDKQAGVKPYALDNSALIPLFTVPGEPREVE